MLKQEKKKESIKRPIWLIAIYILIMTAFSCNGAWSIPWYQRYLAEFVVIGVGVFYLLVTGDLRRLKIINEFFAIFGLPFLLMIVLSMLFWILDFQQIIYMSRGCSSILYHVISLTAMCMAVYLFGERTIDYTLCGMCLGNFGVVLYSIKTYGISAFLAGMIIFMKSGGIDTTPPIKMLEIHDLTFAFGLMILYYLLYTKGKRRFVGTSLSIVFYVIGLKRIGLIGITVVLMFFLILNWLKETFQKTLVNMISVFAIVLCFLYVYSIASGWFDWVVDTLQIDTMGRKGLYAAFRDIYSFSPYFRGYGIGFVTRYISIMTEQKVGIFGTHNFGGMHNDLVTLYIELGFFGFAIWIWYSWHGRIFWVWERFERNSALLLLYETIYVFVTYATDNTVFYCYVNTILMLLPIAHAVGYQELIAEEDEYYAETGSRKKT